jgi:crossover junction endodeoxyribonuclease RuvC
MGNASKEQVRYMVCQILKLENKSLPKYLDVSDAISVALCHCNKLSSGISAKHLINWEDYVEKNPGRVRLQ